HHREFDRKSAFLPNTFFDVFSEFTEVRVARCQLRPCVTYPDHRATIKKVVRESLILHPCAMNKGVPIEWPEPGLTSQGGGFLVHLESYRGTEGGSKFKVPSSKFEDPGSEKRIALKNSEL